MWTSLLLTAALLANDPTSGWNTTLILPQGGPIGGAAGESVAVFGNRAAVGAPNAGTGCVYVLERSGPGAPFLLAATLYPPTGVLGDRFGASVSMPRDGFVVVGSPRAGVNFPERGIVHVFSRQSAGNWTEDEQFLGAAAGDRFGSSLAAKDTTSGALVSLLILIGAPQHATAGVVGSGAAYAASYDPIGMIQTQLKISPPDPTQDARFGASVALDLERNWGVVGAPGDSQGAPQGGAVYIHTSSGTWPLVAKRWAADAAAGTFYGTSVAAAENCVVVGTPRHDGGGNDAGALYVLQPVSNVWTEVARLEGTLSSGRLGASVDLTYDTGAPAWRLLAAAPGVSLVYSSANATGAWTPLVAQSSPDGVPADGFGAAVALVADAAVVGASRHDAAGQDAGAAYSFDAASPPWSATRHLPSHAAPDERFGEAVDVDGDWMVVGVSCDNDLGLGSGSAFVWERSAGVWNQTAKLTGEELGGDVAKFGSSIALDGDTVAIGAPYDSTLATDAGAVFVFRRVGTSWTREAHEPSNVAFAGTGRSVALDGDLLLAGAPNQGAGAVACYERNGNAWSAASAPSSPDGATGDGFGRTLALEGTTLAVGAPAHATAGVSDAGAVYLFERVGATWAFQQKLVSVTQSVPERFGAAVALDGPWLVVGAPRNGISGPDSGIAYVYRRGPSGWTYTDQLTASNGSASAAFGNRVTVHGQTIVIGAPFSSTHGASAGAAYLFAWDGFVWTELAEVPPVYASAAARRGLGLSLWNNTLAVGAPGLDVQHPFGGGVELYDLIDRPQVYCAGKPNSLGCVPFMAHYGTPSATSTQPFILHGVNLVAGEPAFLLYGFAKSNLSFHGGKLCVKLPFRRLLPPKAAQAVGAPPCTGMIERNFQNRIQSGVDPLLTVGQRVFTQWRTRDPNDPAGFGDGFTDAVRFTVCP